MRLISSLLATTLIALLGCSGGDGFGNTERREFDRLEESLNYLSTAPEQDWLERLEQIRELPLKSERVATVRRICVSAYDAFAVATERLRDARKQVALAEKNATNPSLVDRSKLESVKTEAMKSTQEVSRALDKAENLVAGCAAERVKMRNELAGHR